MSAELLTGTNLSNPTGPIEVEVTQTYSLDYLTTDGAAYDSISTIGGQLIINLESKLGASATYELVLTSVEQDEKPLVFSGMVLPRSNSVLMDENLNEKSLLLHLDENGNATSNSFLFTLTYRITVQPGESIRANEGLDVSIMLKDQVFGDAYGDFGQQSLSSSAQGIDMMFFNRFESGSITFANPSIQFNYTNSFGLPFSADYSGVRITSLGSIILCFDSDDCLWPAAA